VAGIITEFIAGVFFYLYNATLKQINLFHSELQASRRTALGLLLQTTVQDEQSRDKTKLSLAERLIGGAVVAHAPAEPH